MSRRLTLSLALASALTTLLLLGARRPDHGGTVRLPIATPIQTLDPLRATSPAELAITSVLFDSPYDLNELGRPQPHLLYPVIASGGGRLLRLKVRPHAVFHDGTPVRASHVVSSLQRLVRDPEQGWLLAMLDGNPSARSGYEGIKLVGTNTVQLRMRSGRATELLVQALATPRAGIVPSSRGASRGLGSGPFILRNSRGRDRLLRSNHDYFDGPPYLAEIRLLAPVSRDDHIRRFQLEKADASLQGVSVYGEQPPIKGIALTEGAPSVMVVLIFNSRRGPARQLPLRRAIDLALDRRRLASSSALPFALPGTKVTPPDVSRAKSLAAGLGYSTSSRSLVLMVDDGDATGLSLAPMLQRDLSAIGIPLDRVVVNASERRSRLKSGQWDLRIQTLAPLSTEEVIILGQLLALGGQQADAARLIQKAPFAQKSELRRAVRVLQTELPLLPLFKQQPRLHHRTHLRGVVYDSIGRLDLANIWIRPRAKSGRRRR